MIGLEIPNYANFLNLWFALIVDREAQTIIQYLYK
jgi:hypothetical protein